MCSQQSKGAKRPQKSFNRADAFFIKITRFHAALKPIFRSLKPFQAFSSLFNLRARVFSFYMNTHIRVGKRLENRPFLVGSDDMNGVFKILVVFRRDTIRLIFPSTSSA